MQNGKTIKTRKNVDFNVDIFILTNVCKNHLPFAKVRDKIFVSDQVAETCDACDRTEDLRALRFSIYADFYRR